MTRPTKPRAAAGSRPRGDLLGGLDPDELVTRRDRLVLDPGVGHDEIVADRKRSRVVGPSTVYRTMAPPTVTVRW